MDISRLEHWHFGHTKEEANALLSLVLEGKKTATASSMPAYEISGEALPAVGEKSVITDGEGVPRCVVHTTRVQVRPYREIPFALARLEGEDETLASWRAHHSAFWTAEGARRGYVFSPEMRVVFEEFEVVEILDRTHKKGEGVCGE